MLNLIENLGHFLVECVSNITISEEFRLFDHHFEQFTVGKRTGQANFIVSFEFLNSSISFLPFKDKFFSVLLYYAVISLLLLADASTGTTQAKVIQKEGDFKTQEQFMHSQEKQVEKELVNTIQLVLSVGASEEEKPTRGRVGGIQPNPRNFSTHHEGSNTSHTMCKRNHLVHIITSIQTSSHCVCITCITHTDPENDIGVTECPGNNFSGLCFN